MKKSFWNWGTGIATVYSVFALSTVGFVVFASSRHVDLVSDDYYAQAVALDARRAAEARARGLGAAFAIDIAANGAAADIQWPAGSVVTGTVKLYRPSDASADRDIDIAPDRSARQHLDLSTLASGRWRLQVDWVSGDARYYAERELVRLAERELEPLAERELERR
jgi:hypothetical protein